MEHVATQPKLKVLIVEDSAVVAARIMRMLNELEEITVVGEAMNSKEAMIITRVMSPDVVFLDISIPGKSGIHVLTEIKQNYPNTKVVMLTNYSESYYRNLCDDLGADSFLDKSTEFEKIPDVLSSLVKFKIHP